MNLYKTVIAVLIFSIVACQNDDKQRTKLMGHWNLSHGELNDNAAPSLEKVFFEFNKDSVRTNFTLSEQEESGLLIVNNKKMIQKTAEPIEYELEEITDSTLEMTTTLRGSDFRLTLKKEIK